MSGGIPIGVPGFVTSVYEMQCDAKGKFISISGFSDDKILHYCKFTNQNNITYLIATQCYDLFSSSSHTHMRITVKIYSLLLLELLFTEMITNLFLPYTKHYIHMKNGL